MNTTRQRVLLFIVSYNAEDYIADVLKRIPETVWNNPNFDTECLIIDDQSADKSFQKSADFGNEHPDYNVTILYNPENQGYGGNQKIGYYYAIQNNFDVVVLLHGDGQYPPERIEDLVSPILNGEADAVFGSRMIQKGQALKGKMPLYKWIGNQILTGLQNSLLKTKLSEYHTGFRAYRVQALASVPFSHNSNYFDFDTDIVIQLLDTKKHILELPIPTHYGTETSHVNSFRYGLMILRTTLVSRLIPYGIFYHPKFDYSQDNSVYCLKLGYTSSHQFALDRVQNSTFVLDLGSGPGFMAQELAQKHVRTISVDRFMHPKMEAYSHKAILADLEQFDFSVLDIPINYVLLLDIIEHLKVPEKLLARIRDHFGDTQPEIIITTANIAFIITRLGLLFGQFNYGKRGILDLDHSRLFTFASLRRILELTGYEIVEERGIPAPFPLAFGDNSWSRILLRLNMFMIRLSKGLFSYQIAVIARPTPTLAHLLKNAKTSSGQKLEAQASLIERD